MLGKAEPARRLSIVVFAWRQGQHKDVNIETVTTVYWLSIIGMKTLTEQFYDNPFSRVDKGPCSAGQIHPGLGVVIVHPTLKPHLAVF